MAERQKEETEFKALETLALCINNCGFSGNPATNGMCQKCFQAAEFLSSRSRSGQGKRKLSSFLSPEREKPTETIQIPPVEPQHPRPSVRQVNRCSGCRKKVGLTGIRCRCGQLFCSEHRYTDRHMCSYDYKAAGRAAIARENPVVKAAKIVQA